MVLGATGTTVVGVGATVVGATVVGATVVVVGATVVGATVVGATVVVVGATVVGATVVVVGATVVVVVGAGATGPLPLKNGSFAIRAAAAWVGALESNHQLQAGEPGLSLIHI